MNVIENLVEAHKKNRFHFLRLLEGLTEEQWVNSAGGNWSIQRSAVHIVNSELYWMGVVDGKEKEYLAKDTSLESFLLKQDKVAVMFREKVKLSGPDIIWKNGTDKEYSLHWIFVRTMQHAIYHCGMISAHRHLVGAPRLENMGKSWGPMVDSLFESHLN